MRMLSTAFYMLLSILGLSVISLAALIGVQYFRGKVSGGDLHSMFRVLGGTYRIMIPSQTYERYLVYARDEQLARAELEQNRGISESREPPGLQLKEAQEAQRQDLDVQNRLLDEQKRIIEALRSEIDAQKNQVQNLVRALDEERQRRASVERDEATAKLRKTLSEMEAEDIGAFLSQIIRDPSQGGAVEAARIIRQHLGADFSAEVLGEMAAQDRQQVIPLLENQYAGVPPEAVVKMFVDNRMSAGEMMIYMQQMNSAQALGVFLRLPPVMQEQLSPQLLRAM